MNLQTIIALMAIAPGFWKGVKAAEKEVPIPQSGQEKLQLVVGTAELALAAGGVPPTSAIRTTLTSMANVAVGVMNIVGIFKKPKQEQ